MGEVSGQESINLTLLWTAISAIGALLAVFTAIVVHISQRLKDRRQGHVDSMLKFAGDFYNDPQMCQLFLKVQSGNLTRRSIRKKGSADELALAHLLEYLNTVGIALERKLVTINAVAATSIAYLVLTLAKDATVTAYLAETRCQHKTSHIPSPGWPQFEYLAQRLAVYARKHPGTPDLRPWYNQLVSPNRGWHQRQVQEIESTSFDWRSREILR